MSEISKRIISGSIAGATTGLLMELLRRSEQMTTYSVLFKSIMAGGIAIAIYMLTMLALRLNSAGTPPKA
ncbi:MAG: hypothetical protein ACYC2I_08645 [Elusimicrobiales bacterium]